MPLVALLTNFGGGLPAGMLQANSGATTLSAVPVIKFCGGLPDGVMLAHGGLDDTFDGPGHQVWRQAP